MPKAHEERMKRFRSEAENVPGKIEEFDMLMAIYLPDLLDMLGADADITKAYAVAEKRAVTTTENRKVYPLADMGDD